jgi:hypothetical protein
MPKMRPDRTAIDSGSAPMDARSRTNGRSAVTNAPAGRLDGRSAIGRRVKDLFAALMARLGEPVDVVAQADVLAPAELKVAAEVARARLLEGKNQNSNECVRLENLVRRAEARVGLEPGATTKTEPGDWRDLFAEDDDDQPADDTDGAAL